MKPGSWGELYTALTREAIQNKAVTAELIFWVKIARHAAKRPGHFLGERGRFVWKYDSTGVRATLKRVQ